MTRKGQRFLFLACYLAYTATYIARLNLTMASPVFIGSGLMDEAQIGLQGSVFAVTYACGRLFNGWLSDRVPPWKMICSGLILVCISNVSIGLFPPFAGMLILWGVNAFAQSMLWSSILRLLAAAYPEAVVKKKASYMVTAVAAGNILGILLNSAVIQRLGLCWAFFVPGGIALIMGALVFAAAYKLETPSPETSRGGLGGLFKDRDFRTMLLPALFHGIIKENISLWMTVYIIQRYSVDLGASAWYVMLIPVVGLFGRLGCPLCFSLCRGSELRVLRLSFALCAAAALLLAVDPPSPLAAVLLLSLLYAAISVINSAVVTVYPIRFSASGNIASASGVLDFATYIGAGIGSVIYGFVIRGAGYRPVFASWILLSAASFVLVAGMLHRQSSGTAKGK